MSQKKMKLINKFLKVKHLDNLVIIEGGPKNLSKQVKRFYHQLPKMKKSGFSQDLKENYETAYRTNS